uniref:IBR domain-containing protein n=1 Tax=Panagrellus redivivus TaxID=6233 RepID=A0A7E4ZQ49_PANRE
MSYPDEKPHIGSHTKSKAHHNALLKTWHQQGKKHDVFCKTIVNPDVLTKKQRARLIQHGNDASQFAFDVTYSMNKKNRWQAIGGADDLVAMDADVLPQQVQLEGSDVLTCNSKKRFVETHFEREIDGSVTKTTNRESALGTLDRVVAKKHKQKAVRGVPFVLREDGKDDESEAKDSETPVVRYVNFKAHQVPQMYSNSHFRGSKNFGTNSGKRGAGADFSDECESDYDDDADSDLHEPVKSTYSAPKHHLYSLSDFVVKKDAVAASSKSESSIDFVEDAHDFMDDFKTLSFGYVDALPVPSSYFFYQFDRKWKKGSEENSFISDFEALGTVRGYTFRWLNTQRTSCIVDLTERLCAGETSIALVIVFELMPNKTNVLRILVSGSFPNSDDLSIDKLRGLYFYYPVDFVDAIFQRAEETYDKAHNYSKFLGDITEYQSVYYSDHFTHGSCDNRATVLICPKITDISIESSNATDSDVLNDEDSGKNTSICYICDTDALAFPLFDSCNHSFCRDCVRSELTDAIANQSQYPLKCLNAECMAPIRTKMLYAVLPLPIIKLYYRNAFKAEGSAGGHKTVRCPGCRNFLNVKINPKFGSITCVYCSVTFCLKCSKRPHYPLNCAEFKVWDKRFKLQRRLNATPRNRIAKCPCGTIHFLPERPIWTVKCPGCGEECYYDTYSYVVFHSRCIQLTPYDHPNAISGKYNDICAPAYKARFNPRMALRFVGDSSQKEAAVSAQKLALHFLELGFAWLYLNEGKREDVWNDVRVSLMQLNLKWEDVRVIIDRNAVSDKVSEEKVSCLIHASNNVLEVLKELEI